MNLPLSLLVAALMTGVPASAATLKILQPAQQVIANQFLSSPLFNDLYSRFDEVIEVSLGDADATTGADAYVVNLINGGGINAPYYSSAELASLAQLLQGDRPALIPFAWAAWEHSNVQLAGLLGGTYSSPNVSSLPIEAHPVLSTGITGQSILLGSPGAIAWDGTQVIGDVVTLAGPNDNVVLLGDISIVSYSLTLPNPDNARFTSNLADFLAVPEPSVAGLFAVGAAGAAWRRRRVGVGGDR